MSSETNDEDGVTLRPILNELRKPIHNLDALKALLRSSSKRLQIRTIDVVKSETVDRESGASAFPASDVRHILPLQEVILQQIIPTWYHTLVEDGSNELVDVLFNPRTDSKHPSAFVAAHAHTALLSALPSSPAFAVNLLEHLVKDWPLDKIHFAMFSSPLEISDGQLQSLWSDYLRAVFAIPAKVANSTKNNSPERLTFR
ncbi:telomere binding protein [Tulasnella sp. 408]|nr:telomere binding protein [Tulasnella sp. 408]